MYEEEKIINSDGLQFDPDMEILEFNEMIEAKETGESEEEPNPIELNKFEFFIQVISYFECETKGILSSSEQSPASPVESANYRIEINAIKSEILRETIS